MDGQHAYPPHLGRLLAACVVIFSAGACASLRGSAPKTPPRLGTLQLEAQALAQTRLNHLEQQRFAGAWQKKKLNWPTAPLNFPNAGELLVIHGQGRQSLTKFSWQPEGLKIYQIMPVASGDQGPLQTAAWMVHADPREFVVRWYAVQLLLSQLQTASQRWYQTSPALLHRHGTLGFIRLGPAKAQDPEIQDIDGDAPNAQPLAEQALSRYAREHAGATRPEVVDVAIGLLLELAESHARLSMPPPVMATLWADESQALGDAKGLPATFIAHDLRGLTKAPTVLVKPQGDGDSARAVGQRP